MFLAHSTLPLGGYNIACFTRNLYTMQNEFTLSQKTGRVHVTFSNKYNTSGSMSTNFGTKNRHLIILY